ncbi:unnamed protein product [Periconia digitata]|uniref:Thiamine phosphate synthase/TenI domain-containing protein n=1 Tax=Periconia digitata TaxID=1303443 RepID=A0A9W4UF23_9PLEO|nr:unnamed protein product [Periconia digitata]
MKPTVDYSLYLVTDSTEAILGKRNLVHVVEEALKGGVTVVQYRDKKSDTGALISTAKALHEKCLQHKVPLIINDRVDVALAVDCEGVHLGQDDMSVFEARKILGSTKIIGATVSTIQEAKVAVEHGADYLGIGTVYATDTKKNTKDIIGVYGVRQILHHLSHNEKSFSIDTVCIGGINASNIQRVHQQTCARPGYSKQLSGVAVVSAIIASADPQSAAQHLIHLFKNSNRPKFAPRISKLFSSSVKGRKVLNAIKAVHNSKPLTHNMTNLVVQNFAANVALCMGASPIMSNNGSEAPDLATLEGGLVVNMGTSTPDALLQYRRAIEAYNAVGNPVVLDPVGAGATTVRRDALKYLLNSGYFTVIKGNQSEILAVAKAAGLPDLSLITASDSSESQQQRGVDSQGSLSSSQALNLVSKLAKWEHTTILMTGSTDYLSDGTSTVAIKNGHAYLGSITGTGCTLGTAISAYLAASNSSASPEELKVDSFTAVLAAILHFEIAAEDAAQKASVEGPGTFVPAFLDSLYKIRMDVVEERLDQGWLDQRKLLEDLDVDSNQMQE